MNWLSFVQGAVAGIALVLVLLGVLFTLSNEQTRIEAEYLEQMRLREEQLGRELQIGDTEWDG